MLYVSTRNRTDSYTAHRALHEQHAADGGLFVPFQLPFIDEAEISRMHSRSFCENIADILNRFFSVQLTGWDIEFCIGRYPAKTVVLPRKITVAELWHNLSASYNQMEQAIYARLSVESADKDVPEWVRIAIHIAFLFAAYCATDAASISETVDLALESDGFTAPMAAWYARQMGLPIETVICACADFSEIWDILHKGNLNSLTTQADSAGLERLIYVILGQEEAVRFYRAQKEHASYILDDQQRLLLSQGMFAAVVSNDRVHSVINSFYRSNQYIFDSNAAVSYAALQDYRSKTGESRNTILFSLDCPANQPLFLTRCLGISKDEIDRIVHRRKG